MEDLLFFPPLFYFVQVLFCLFEGGGEEEKIHSLDEMIPIRPGVVEVVLGSQGDHWAEAHRGLRRDHTTQVFSLEN